MLRKCYTLAFSFALFFLSTNLYSQQGVLIETGSGQKQLLSVYRLILESSAEDYHETGWDEQKFAPYGEHSIYWLTGGPDKGNFLYPSALPEAYGHISSEAYNQYDLSVSGAVSVQFKKHPRRIAIFKSKYKANSVPLNWESLYFERLFSEHLMGDIFYTVNEDSLIGNKLDENTKLLIIPSFVSKELNVTYYIDSLFNIAPDLSTGIQAFVNQGGNIYAEGSGVYFVRKSGFLENTAIHYSSSSDNHQLITLNEGAGAGALNLGFYAAGGSLYGVNFPLVNSSRIRTIATSASGNPCVFTINPVYTSGNRIICNTGLPTVSGLSGNITQINWTMAAILSVFSFDVDVTRKVQNDLGAIISAGDNSVSYDRLDTVTVKVTIRNLSDQPVSGIVVKEEIRKYVKFIQVTSGDSYTLSGNSLVFGGIDLPAHGSTIITYAVSTPDPQSSLHDDAEMYIDRGTLMALSTGHIHYLRDGFQNQYTKSKDYANVLFSAMIFADTDVNWKNFLNLEYQPFKVFMIMENKSRSPALHTLYTQYIPKDVPFYWSDNSINVPILRTPGGKFVDVLKGSNDQDNPEYDMDSDGHPDVWLDTASIFPKGYTIAEEEVYWANPWNHLRTGVSNFVFEDIDHDGNMAVDNNGDGIPENEEPGDKIRVWKVTWDLGKVEGYEYHDPYSSYEIWVDPPDLVPLSAGVGYANDSLPSPYPGMFYPYTPDIQSADLSDTSWSHWMERDENGRVIWKQLVHQRINNYEGFTFIDTADLNYHRLPTDSVIGTCPQPHREFIAVLSLGGEEIDMTHYLPQQSLYSKIDYETVFGEERTTPIRTTYTYWAPLPNPLQFEYLSNNYSVTDTTGRALQDLPEYGPAKLIFDLDASTEYTYYWIRNVGHDVDFNDPSELAEGIEELGDGVFGYFVYSIPKGMGGYRITLPQNEDGTYITNEIVSLNGQPFSRWLNNPNTPNDVEIWETPFEYQVYIPQILIPPALDDDNHNGLDDWADDRGDRFHSSTGFLHDRFMPDHGEDWPNEPPAPFRDDIYGMVESGWYAGADQTYGDDYFEIPGKTHIQIHADYTGRGREGPVEISKGGVLVAEEIFGGSPWVIFSHVLSGFAKGSDISVQSQVIPEVVYYGRDTVYLKHVIADTNEPHYFNADFDPYHVSYGYGETTITTFTGAKDPCGLIEPAISMPAVIDPAYDHHNITLIPNADPENPELTGYPKALSGTFVEIRVEINNSTNDNWINTTVTPELGPDLGNSSVELRYVAYPRPLVPSHYDNNSGAILKGDQPGTFTTGWRFNQPEGEVLVSTGNVLNLMQPTRRAYFVFLIKVDPSLEPGNYSIPLSLSGNRKHYSGTSQSALSYEIPDARFSITEKDRNGMATDFQPVILDHSDLGSLQVSATGNFVPTGRIKWSTVDFNPAEFNSVQSVLQQNAGGIDLSQFSMFPVADTTQIVILQEGIADTYNTDAEIMSLTNGQTLTYSHTNEENTVASGPLSIRPVGPRIRVRNSLYSINGVPVVDTILYEPEEDVYLKTRLSAVNTGSDISSNTVVHIYPGSLYEVLADSLDASCSYNNGMLTIDFGDIVPGELKEQMLPFVLHPADLPRETDIRTVIEHSVIDYEGTLVDLTFRFTDTTRVIADLYDFEATAISFTDLGNGEVQVNATAGNRGMASGNIWVRIYPVFGGGAHEFPLCEMRFDSLEPMQTVQLTGTYTIPATDKSIEFLMIVDDGYDYTEITELNNSIEITYLATGNAISHEKLNNISVYPVPFNDEVHFAYYLYRDYIQVSLYVYDLSGKLYMQINDCPVNKGTNNITWRNTSMPEGNYIYKMTAEDASGIKTMLFTGNISKIAR